MKGYLIKDSEGNYLAKKLRWYTYQSMQDAYVHSPESIDLIKKEIELGVDNMLPGRSWSEPIEKIPATWARDKGVVVVGEPESWS